MSSYLDVIVFAGYRNILGQTLTEPHGNVSLHIYGKRFESFLQATDRKVTQTADVLTEIDPPDLGQAQSTNWDET